MHHTSCYFKWNFVFMFNNTIFLWCTKGRKLPCNIMWFTKFLNSLKIYSLWFSYCNIFSLFLAHVFLQNWICFVILMTFLIETSLSIYFDISSINKSKYQTSPCVCVCVAHIYQNEQAPTTLWPMFLYHLEMHIDIVFTSNIQVTQW